MVLSSLVTYIKFEVNSMTGNGWNSTCKICWYKKTNIGTGKKMIFFIVVFKGASTWGIQVGGGGHKVLKNELRKLWMPPNLMFICLIHLSYIRQECIPITLFAATVNMTSGRLPDVFVSPCMAMTLAIVYACEWHAVRTKLIGTGLFYARLFVMWMLCFIIGCEALWLDECARAWGQNHVYLNFL